MKKSILVLAFVSLFASVGFSQVDGKALGLRFGGTAFNGAEISYQHPLSNSNRLELGVGTSGWGLGLTGIYQWVWDLSALADGFNWYAGAGGVVGIHNTMFGLGVAGQVGIEYSFNIPLQLSLDYRPTIYFIPAFHDYYDGICLSVRYKF